MQVQLWIATPADLPHLFEWMRQLRAADPMETESIVSRSTSESAMVRLIDDSSAGRVWIVNVDGNAVGYVVLVFSFSVEFGGRTAFIDELLIDERFRGRGIGREVVDQVIEYARALGVQNLLLEVTESNLPARRLYQSAGFLDRKYRLMSKWIGGQ